MPTNDFSGISRPELMKMPLRYAALLAPPPPQRKAIARHDYCGAFVGELDPAPHSGSQRDTVTIGDVCQQDARDLCITQLGAVVVERHQQMAGEGAQRLLAA